MIQAITQFIDKLVSNPRLAAAEKKVLDKYESLTKVPEEVKEELEVKDVPKIVKEV